MRFSGIHGPRLNFQFVIMPTISLDRADLFDALGKEYSEQELDELCFEYGIELDEWVDDGHERPTVKIEIPANRYDMLCAEGLARSLAVFLGRIKPPKYKVKVPEKPLELTIEPEVSQIRPYAAAAVIRGVKFTPRRYESFISLQDKLHSNICRNRSLVAIGTHDLSKVTGNLRYRGLKPEDVKFAPLNQSKEMTGSEVLEFYRSDRNLSKFVPLIESSPVLPVFVDSKDTVLSLPPLINSDFTKITLDTTDIFFDLTGTDETKLDIVLNQMVTMFSEYAEEPYTVEAVRVKYADGRSKYLPNLDLRHMPAEVDYLNSVLGLGKTAKEYCELLTKMTLEAEPISDKVLEVGIPVTRPDILHQCDIMEDAGVAYGFNNLKRTFPGSSTIGQPLLINQVADIAREEAAQAGWAEVMPLTLSSFDENYNWLRRSDDGLAVELANPKTHEYQVVRTTLIPGILKTIRENREHSLPMKVFECGDIVVKDVTQERMTHNERHFAAVFAGKTSGFEIVHGLLDRLMAMMRFKHERGGERGYWLEEAKESEIPQFFPGRGAHIFLRRDGKTQRIGYLGVLHPEVLSNFEIPFVCSAFELDARVFL